MAGAFKSITAKSLTRHTAHKEYDLIFQGTGTQITSASFDGTEALVFKATHEYWESGNNNWSEYSGSNYLGVATNTHMLPEEQFGTNVSTIDLANTIRGRFYHAPYVQGQRCNLLRLEKSQIYFSFPQLMIGDGIKPGTFQASFYKDSSWKTISDDGKGVLLADEYPYNLSASATSSEFTLYTHPFQHGTVKAGLKDINQCNSSPNQLVQATFFNCDTLGDKKQENTSTSIATNRSFNSSGLDTPTNGIIMSHSYADEGPGNTDASHSLWLHERSSKPTDYAFGWLPSLPSYFGPGTNTFNGVTIWIYFKYNKAFSMNNASSKSKWIWTLGKSPDSNDATDSTSLSLGLKLEDGTSGGIKLIMSGIKGTMTNTATGITPSDGDTISVCCRIDPDGYTHLHCKNHTDNATVAAVNTGSNFGLVAYADSKISNRDARNLVIGAGYKPSIIETPGNVYGGPMIQEDARALHGACGMSIFDFRIWSTDIGYAAADQLAAGYTGEIGNIWYEEGLATMNGSDIGYSVPTGLTASFNNTVVREEYEYVCMIADNEFNMSQNPSILHSASTDEYKQVKEIVSSGDWDPYITTIGLYDDTSELLAIGKLSRPMRKVEHYDQTFIIKFDK